jgi:hypothetical protein
MLWRQEVPSCVWYMFFLYPSWVRLHRFLVYLLRPFAYYPMMGAQESEKTCAHETAHGVGKFG